MTKRKLNTAPLKLTNNWLEELPCVIKLSVEKGLAQSENGQSIPHAEVMKRYVKWLKK